MAQFQSVRVGFQEHTECETARNGGVVALRTPTAGGDMELKLLHREFEEALRARMAGSGVYLNQHAIVRRRSMSNSENQPVIGPQRSGCSGIAVALIGATLSILYLANLTFGVVEIPDNLPIIGNIDEVVVSGILFTCLSRLGINPIPNFRGKSQVPRDR